MTCSTSASRSPTATKMIGALRSARPSRDENRPQANTNSAINATAPASMFASLPVVGDSRPHSSAVAALGQAFAAVCAVGQRGPYGSPGSGRGAGGWVPGYPPSGG
jgi:hypothetical protein